MIRTIRRPAAVLVAVATAFVLAGCGSGPRQADAAAIVGDQSIPLDAIQNEINWVLDNVPAAQQAQQQRKLDVQAREIVRGRVVHELLAVASRREGLRADPAEVDELIESSGGVQAVARNVGIMPSRVREVAADQVLLQELGERYTDRVTIRVVGTQVVQESADATAKDQAREIGEKIAANPANAQAIISDSGKQVIDQRLTLASAVQNQPELAISALFGAPQDSVVVIQPSREQAGWLVGLIAEREVAPAAGQSQQVQADPQVLYWVGMRQLQPIADELGVQLNPRYGVWDDAAMAPAASAEEVTGYQLRSRTVQP